MKKEVLENQERFSLIGVNNEFIVPGGRFREFYYWDAYWIVRGLAISGMYDSILLEVSNFAQMIKRFVLQELFEFNYCNVSKICYLENPIERRTLEKESKNNGDF